MMEKKNSSLLLNIMVIIIFIVVSVTPVSVVAEAGNAEAISQSDEAVDILKKYVSNEKGVFTYDRDAAVKSGESEEILKIADIAFAYLQKSMDNRKDMSKKQGENIKKTESTVYFPVYGNWCGPGHGSGTPIDTLDEGCRRHDDCYGKYKNKSKCKCDKDLIKYIDRNIGKMSGKEKTFAKAIRAFFVWKRGLNGCK